MALQSMTGFAEAEEALGAVSWRWEIRSVNGRGLDLRYRGPDGHEALEPKIRAAAQKRLARGSVSIGLRLGKSAVSGSLTVNEAALASAIAAAATARRAAEAAGLEVAPLTAEGLLGKEAKGKCAGAIATPAKGTGLAGSRRDWRGAVVRGPDADRRRTPRASARPANMHGVSSGRREPH